jgi:hypothetical protein
MPAGLAIRQTPAIFRKLAISSRIRCQRGDATRHFHFFVENDVVWRPCFPGARAGIMKSSAGPKLLDLSASGRPSGFIHLIFEKRDST